METEGSEEWILEVCSDPHVMLLQFLRNTSLRKTGSTYKPIKREVYILSGFVSVANTKVKWVLKEPSFFLIKF